MAFLKPRMWNKEDFRVAAQKSLANFSLSRKTEGLDYYLGAYEEAALATNELLDKTDDLLSLEDEAASLFFAGKLREIRYLASPAISEDDLKNLAELKSVSKTALSHEANARRAMEIILMNVDPNRFPWVQSRRRPTREERATAVIASASLMASQETQTKRRNLARANQENSVAYFLQKIGYEEVKRRRVLLSSHAPSAHEFCREAMVGDKKADFVIGLADGRFMALECKVSNSEVNSYKRLNHETVEKVQHWNALFGANGVVGAAVLAGVFKVSNLVDAQEAGVTIFWSHDLEPLGSFLRGIE